MSEVTISPVPATPPAYGLTKPPDVARMIAVDLETSGLYPSAGDCMTWLGIAPLEPNAALVTPLAVAVDKPQRPSYFQEPPAQVHRAPIADVVAAWAKALTACDVVVAHHADFDAAFALNEFAKAGLQLPERPWLCTMLLARHLFPEWRNHKLSTCLAEAGIPLGGEEHDAGAEAVACAALARYLIDVAKDAGIVSLHDLLGVAGVRPGVEDPDKWDGRQPRIEALPPNSRFYAHKRAHRDLEELEHGWPPLSQQVAAVEALRDAGCGNVNAVMADVLSGRYETPEDGPWYINSDHPVRRTGRPLKDQVAALTQLPQQSHVLDTAVHGLMAEFHDGDATVDELIDAYAGVVEWCESLGPLDTFTARVCEIALYWVTMDERERVARWALEGFGAVPSGLDEWDAEHWQELARLAGTGPRARAGLEVALADELDPYQYEHEHDDLVETLLRGAIDGGCTDVTAHWRLAELLERQDRVDEAIALCERAALIPGLPSWKAELLRRRASLLEAGPQDEWEFDDL